MKAAYVFFFLVFFLKVSSQTVEQTIILKDAETNMPIEDATVLILKTKQIYLSNADGRVEFSLKGASNIQISHTSYVAQTLRSSALKEKENVIFLKNNVNNLEEIIITKQHPQKILKTLVDNSKKNLTVPARLKVYCREFFKLNGKYSYYNDGLMNFQLFDKNKDFNSNILVEQNRSYGLMEEDVTNDLLGYNLNNIMENYYNFKYLNILLDPKAKKDFDFLIRSYSKNDNYYKLTATPLDDAKGLLDNFTIIYDHKKKIIIEVNSEISEATFAKNEEKSMNNPKSLYKSLFKTIYKNDGSNYYLVSSREEIGFNKIKKGQVKSIEVINYFLTNNFSNKNYSYKDSDVFKDKTLFNKHNSILTDYWNTSGLTPTEEEEAIIQSIEFKE